MEHKVLLGVELGDPATKLRRYEEEKRAAREKRTANKEMPIFGERKELNNDTCLAVARKIKEVVSTYLRKKRLFPMKKNIIFRWR